MIAVLFWPSLIIFLCLFKWYTDNHFDKRDAASRRLHAASKARHDYQVAFKGSRGNLFYQVPQSLEVFDDDLPKTHEFWLLQREEDEALIAQMELESGQVNKVNLINEVLPRVRDDENLSDRVMRLLIR